MASRLSTRVLLTCAAIGVATGLLGGIEGWLAVPVISLVPILYGFLLGVHVLPGIIAQEALRLPWVALITHGLAALVSAAVAPPYAMQFLGTAVLFGGIQELVAAAVRYRTWAPWRFFISGLVIGALVAAAVYFAADLDPSPGGRRWATSPSRCSAPSSGRRRASASASDCAAQASRARPPAEPPAPRHPPGRPPRRPPALGRAS